MKIWGMRPCVDKPFNSSAEKNADKQSESVTCGPKNQLQITNSTNLSDNNLLGVSRYWHS